MTLDLDAIKASQKRVYYGTDLADKEAHALAFLDSGVVDDLVAEVDRSRAALALQAESVEEAARHALRWQAEYDTAQQEIERLRAEVDTCTGCGSSLLACLRWVNDLDPAHLKCCPDCHHPQEHLVWLDLREGRDEARAEVERLRRIGNSDALACIAQVKALTRERDEARAAIARVEALCDESDRTATSIHEQRLLTPSDVRAALRGESCHCGEPVVYGYDGDPTHQRGMCRRCDLVRCDAYPGACDAEPRPIDYMGRFVDDDASASYFDNLREASAKDAATQEAIDRAGAEWSRQRGES